MTPAINLVKKMKIAHTVHEYNHDTNCSAYGSEAADKLGISEFQVFKTLVVQLDQHLAVAVIPVARQLSLKEMAKACQSKKALMANPNDVARSTGYVLGGVSPLGQKKSLTTVIDVSANEFTSIYISAGRRGLEIELAPADLQTLCKAQLLDICQ